MAADLPASIHLAIAIDALELAHGFLCDAVDAWNGSHGDTIDGVDLLGIRAAICGFRCLLRAAADTSRTALVCDWQRRVLAARAKDERGFPGLPGLDQAQLALEFAASSLEEAYELHPDEEWRELIGGAGYCVEQFADLLASCRRPHDGDEMSMN